MANKIKIFGNFDGGNPKDPNSIIQTDFNSYKIIPFSEDNDPNYKFRLDVRAVNQSSGVQKLNLTIDWKESKYNHLRNYLYQKHEKDEDWSQIPMWVTQTESKGEFDLKPGKTYMCMHPKYNYEDYINFINKIPSDGNIKKELIGKTQEGCEIWLLSISNENLSPKKKILMVARIHPYETSGSYCIEGIINYFSNHLSPFTFNDSPAKTNYRKPFTFDFSHFTIYLIPMANPNGVYNGFCKLSKLNGIDLSKKLDFNDCSSALLKKAIDKVRPHVYCEFHNWMLHEYDGIYFLNWFQAKRFIRKMPSQKQYKKTWKIFVQKKLFSVIPHGFKKYCREKFGSICVCLEYPWCNRNIEDMKRTGLESLMALTKI